MGDRFYNQQLAATGNCPGSTKSKVQPPKSPTKPEMVERLGIKGLDKLRIPELQALTLVWEDPLQLEIPEGRLKQPYTIECSKIAEVDWSRCTIATLKEVINKFKN